MKLNINYYRVLNISPKANERQIKQTYLRLAQKYHPDKNKGNKLAEKKFKQINEAYHILKDPQSRKLFDDKLKQKPRPLRKKAFSTQTTFRFTPPAVRNPFHPSQAKEQPLDLETTLIVSLETVCQSRPCVINYLKPENGKQTKSSFSIQIPRGIQSGDWLFFKKKGGAASKKIFGDLYVEVQFQPHQLFTVKGWDVSLSLPVPFTAVFLGQATEIPTLSKKNIQFKIPPGISDKTTLRLKKLGLPKKGKGERGDMLVHVLIDYPSGQKRRIQRKMAGLKGSELRNYLKEQAEKPLHYPKVEEYKQFTQKLYRK